VGLCPPDTLPTNIEWALHQKSICS
jgi:hypothetical protein